ILRQPDWNGFVQLLFKPDNALATVAAAVGAMAGFRSRERWTMLLAVSTTIFLAVVSMSNRGLNESYLLPVLPAVWLLASRGIAALSFDRPLIFGAGVAAASVVALFVTMREDVMLAKPDTRVLAKQWVETHVPSGSKILMDGMRFRFVQGVPL